LWLLLKMEKEYQWERRWSFWINYYTNSLS